jgi:hypothetical protein
MSRGSKTVSPRRLWTHSPDRTSAPPRPHPCRTAGIQSRYLGLAWTRENRAARDGGGRPGGRTETVDSSCRKFPVQNKANFPSLRRGPVWCRSSAKTQVCRRIRDKDMDPGRVLVGACLGTASTLLHSLRCTGSCTGCRIRTFALVFFHL